MEDQPEIRLVRSSIALYTSLIIRLAFSIAFVIMTARKLSVEEFAALGLVLAFSMFGSQPTIWWIFWAQRAAARLQRYAIGSSLVITLGYAFIILLPLYIGYSYLEASLLKISPHLLATAWTFVVLTPVLNSLLSLGIVLVPESVAIVRTIYEVTRVALTYLLLVVFGYGYEGVVLSLDLAVAIAILGMFVTIQRHPAKLNVVDRSAIRYWLSNWYIPLTSAVPTLLRTLNRPYISWLTGNSLAVAYLNVAITSETPLLTASRFSAQPMYSRLLRRPSRSDVETAVALYFIFTGLLASLLLGAPKAIVNLYNPKYVDAWIILVLITFYAVFFGLAYILARALMALETGDVGRVRIERSSILVKSIETYAILSILAYLFAAPIILHYSDNPIYSLSSFAISLLLFNFIVSIIFWKWLREQLKVKLPWKDLLGTIAGVIVSVLFLILWGVNESLYREFYLQLKTLVIPLTLAVVVYFTVLIQISPLARRITKRGLNILFRRES